jgi:hypothetical protein
MDHLDYYSVMASRIRYFAKKYDPQNKFGTLSDLAIKVKKPGEIKPISGHPIRKKIAVGFDSVISFFL